MSNCSKAFVFWCLFCPALVFSAPSDSSRYGFLLSGMRYSAVVDFTIENTGTINTLRRGVQQMARNWRTEREGVDLTEEMMAALLLKSILYHTRRFETEEFARDFGTPEAALTSIKTMILEYLDPGQFLFTDGEIASYLTTEDAELEFAQFKRGQWDGIYKIFPVYVAAVQRYRALAFNPDDSQSVQWAVDVINVGMLKTPILANIVKRLEQTRRIERDEFDAVELAMVQQRAEVEDKVKAQGGKYGRMETVYAAVLSGLDRFSTYMFNDNYRRWVQSRPHPKLGTTGLHAVQSLSGLYVKKAYLNMSAFMAGIREGDLILSVDGESLADLPEFAQLVRMRGAPGSIAQLEVLRAGQKFSVAVERRKRTSVFSEVVEFNGRKLGYLELGEFAESSADEVASTLEWLNFQEIDGLVLDLRHNQGGHLNQAVDIAIQLLGEVDPFAYVTHAASGDDIPRARTFLQYGHKSRALKFSKPLVVLTSGMSTSAAELLTMILKDHRRGVVMGARTFGKGVIQTGSPISSVTFRNNLTGRYVRVKNTITGLFFINSAYFVDSRGQSPQAVGVEPDITLFLDPPYDPFVTDRPVPAPLSVNPLKSSSVRWVSDFKWSELLEKLRAAVGEPTIAVDDNAKIKETAFSALQTLIDDLGPQFGPPPKPEERNPLKRACYKILEKIGAR